MKSMQNWLDEYGESHQNPTNKLIHWICVPLIFFSTVGLFWSIPVGPLEGLVLGPYGVYVNWASLALALTTVWYFRMSVPLALGMIVVAGFMMHMCVLVQEMIPYPLWQTCLAIFIVAWIGQFIGHKIEGKKPSFFKDLQFLLVGPMWLMHFVFNKVGARY